MPPRHLAQPQAIPCASRSIKSRVPSTRWTLTAAAARTPPPPMRARLATRRRCLLAPTLTPSTRRHSRWPRASCRVPGASASARRYTSSTTEMKRRRRYRRSVRGRSVWRRRRRCRRSGVVVRRARNLHTIHLFLRPLLMHAEGTCSSVCRVRGHPPRRRRCATGL